MSQQDAALQTLHAYHDGELGWFSRWRFERRLAGSAQLREELESLQQLTGLTAESESEFSLPMGAVWEGIEGRLRAVDASLEAEGLAGLPAPGGALWSGWRPLGAAAVAAVGAAALFLALTPTPGPVGDTAIVSGSVRYLDAGDRSVMVHEEEDVTIIWVMGGVEDV